MGTARTVLVCVVSCSAVQVCLAETDTDRSWSNDVSVTGRHRLAMLFPLLLGIAGRLATLVPTALMAVFGIFLFVAFSKKAFIISVLALFLTYLDKYKNKHGQKVIYVHKNPYSGHHQEWENFGVEDEHYHWPYRKHYGDHHNKNLVPFKNWKKTHQTHSPLPFIQPPMLPPHANPLPHYEYYNYAQTEALRRNVVEAMFPNRSETASVGQQFTQAPKIKP